ncbi:vomeronasal 1 receptor ornAnaV1R3042 [Ornithorhynchus anatinus]|uniref:vomeronasal 1 receptor ornAnaV1R3042 n=1 Tax=Ornithorhynchus anatinus TaxID=9258 RepID=UPI00015565F4|nr:vomeronasal 1 receptor ornAnaV1R3042 [Ornithorhynchus anatinus]
MNAIEIWVGTVMLLQMSIGISENVFLLLFYIHLTSSSPWLNSSDLILTHLTLANTTVFLTKGILDTLSGWGWRIFLGDMGCKTLLYLYRVARGLTICSTCLLSIFQAVTISPRTPRWARIKARFPNSVVPFCLLSWVLNLMIYVSVPIGVRSAQNSSTVSISLDLKYCSAVIGGTKTALVISAVISLQDLFFMVLMSIASGYMVWVLHRYHQQVQHLRTSGRSPRMMPEVRAAKRVMALVTLFILHYGRQSIMLSILINVKEKPALLVNSHLVLSFTFSVISPFLMISGDRRMRRFWKTQSPVSNMGPS